MKPLVERYQRLVNHLIGAKLLPKQYFREEALRQGIPERTIHNWNLQQWLEPERTIHLKPKVLKQRFQVILGVLHRMDEYPDDESYPEAMNRLANTIRAIHTAGISFRKMSDAMSINQAKPDHTGYAAGNHNKTLSKIAGKTWTPANCANLRICPWSIIESLQRVPSLLETDSPSATKHITSPFVNDRTAPPPPPNTKPEHAKHPRCPTCGSPSSHRQLEQDSPLARSNTYTCNSCSTRFEGPEILSRMHLMVDTWMKQPIPAMQGSQT